MSAPRLTSLNDVASTAQQPAYNPQDHAVGIVHLGVGAFHRAHQAAITDDALAHQGGDWRIAAVNLRSKQTAQDLNAQNGLYTVVERDQESTRARVIASIDHAIAADAQATLTTLCQPTIRVVTMTVTEAGYGIDQDRRQPNLDNKEVAHDLTHPENPRGVLGLLVAAIAKRREAKSVPFTVLSCDNLPGNGALVRDGVAEFARRVHGDEMADWVLRNIAFPSSMVDRITPASTDETQAIAAQYTGCVDLAAVETEPFCQWVIEEDFPSGRPYWEAGGALFVADVTPYERMKLTMLNGSHSMLAYAGFLADKPLVRDVMADPDLSILVRRHFKVAAEQLPALRGIDFTEYAGALADRFSNPAIAHETLQIAKDGSQKLPQRIFQPAVVALDAMRDLRAFAFAAAVWMRFCLEYKDDGSGFELVDPRSHEIKRALKSAGDDSAAIAAVFHELPDLIPDVLKHNEVWQREVNDVLSALLAKGCVATLRHEAATVAT